MAKDLESYKVLVDFLADYLGENTEVVLHDLSDCQSSIVAIRNGDISGRELGLSLIHIQMCIRDSYFPTWVIPEDHKVTKALEEAYKGMYGEERIGSSAVSYTHLDVYKRQGLTCTYLRLAKHHQ